MRRAVMMHATAKLSETAEQAVDVLAEVMADADAPSNARVSAARAVLEMNYNAIQADDIMERIEQLESAGSG